MTQYRCTGKTDEWYTPPEILDALGVMFDLDPCSPGPTHWVPARRVYMKADDGLTMPWRGRVFMNPPYGGRNAHVPWLRRFFEHGDGIGVIRAYTSSAWWHEWMHRADLILFPKGKTKFVRPDGTVGGSPEHAVALFAVGEANVEALANSGLGMIAAWQRITVA